MRQVPQDHNEKTNKLARLALSTVESLDPRILMEYLPKINTEAKKDEEVNTANLEPKWAS